MLSSVDTIYAFFLVEVTRFLKKQLVGSAFLLALLKLLIAMTAKTLKSFYNYDKKKNLRHFDNRRLVQVHGFYIEYL